jgi:hypothetical protein
MFDMDWLSLEKSGFFNMYVCKDEHVSSIYSFPPASQSGQKKKAAPAGILPFSIW